MHATRHLVQMMTVPGGGADGQAWSAIRVHLGAETFTLLNELSPLSKAN